MIVNPDSFLRHFGVSIRNSTKVVNSKIRCSCPLHSDSDLSLSIYEDKTNTLFACDHPRCGFKGDAIALVALVKKVTTSEAVDMFRPGGEFADSLAESVTTDEFDAYISKTKEQIELKTYLAKCKQALKRSPEKACIRPGISATTSKLLHPDIGLFLDNDVPKQLQELCKPKYRGACFLLFPYTRDGEITKIDVTDTNNPVFHQTIVITHPSIGVFGESCVGKSVSALVAERPEAIASFYATWALSKPSVPSFVAFQGFPLPESFSSVTGLNLLSTSDYPISIDFLLHMLSVPEVIKKRNPSVRVVYAQKRANDVPDVDLELVKGNGAKRQASLHEAIARRFIEMTVAGKAQEICELLIKEQTPAVARALIKNAAEEYMGCRNPEFPDDAIKEVVKILTEQEYSLSSTIRLANGKTVHRSITDLTGLTQRARRETLCNVGVSVDAKIVSFNNKDIYACTITHADDISPLSIRLDSDVLVSAQRLQAEVIREYSLKGYNPYVAFYNVPGFSWRDIFAKLSEHCKVHREVTELGIDQASDIQLPEVVVHPTGTVQPQSKVFTIADDVLRMYAGIPAETTEPVDAYKNLLLKCDNLYVAAFALGVFHVIYQMTYGLYRPKIVKSHAMRHFMYVETEPGIWGRVFKQVADLFSGNDFTPTVCYANPGKTFSEYKQLGCLPIIAYLPTLGNKLATALDEEGVDLLGLVDTSTATMLNGKVSSVYVTPSEDTPMDRGIIGGKDIDALRKAFIPFLVKFIKEADLGTAYRASSVPCVTVYEECCRIFGVPRFGLVDGICKNYFPGVGMTGFTIFCDLIHRSISEDASPHINVMQGPPQKGYSFTRRGQHVFVMEDIVIMSHMLVDILNQSARGKYKFDTQQLTEEMKDTGLLEDVPEELEIDSTRCWCVSRATWELKIIRPPVNLTAEVTNGTIDLKPINELDRTHTC